MRTTAKIADELWIGDLIIYTNTLYVVSEQRLTVDGHSVASMLIKPYLSDGPLLRVEVLRDPGYEYRNVTDPIFAAAPCDDKGSDILGVAIYTSAHQEIVADYVGSQVQEGGSLPLEGGEVAHYGDVIALIDVGGDNFQYRVIDKYELAKHNRLIMTEADD
nr:MAG TPA: hypothetical protein [Caudoviricetes sp.]